MRRIIRLFKQGNVQVCGLRGSGKDMLTANVVVRRKLPYVSNVDYGGVHYDLDMSKLDCNNKYSNFIDGNVNFYEYPYPDGTDVYISDAGIYFPSQYHGELNKRYPNVPTSLAISRHTGKFNFHTNSQSIDRVWNLWREQGDTFIRCIRCIVIGRLVVQSVVVYDRYQSAVDRVPPFPLRRPLANADRLQLYEIQKSNYLIAHGNVKPMLLIYWNRSKYDTHHFKEVLKNGKR